MPVTAIDTNQDKISVYEQENLSYNDICSDCMKNFRLKWFSNRIKQQRDELVISNALSILYIK
jgi:hypothetical protein